MEKNLIEYLEHIPCSSLEYDRWVEVGMALKYEGYPCSLWEDWSRYDNRYHEGECQRKWETFKGSSEPVTGGTIVQLAKDFGYDPNSEEWELLDWNDEIGVDSKYDLAWVEPVEVEHKKKDIDPYTEIVTYLTTLFDTDERVNIVVKSFKDDDGKFKPSGNGATYTVDKLLKDLKKHKDDIHAAIGDANADAGAWVRFNPMDGNGTTNNNVTDYKYALIESDTLDIPMQRALIKEMKLPVAVLVNSGGKSLHAIVKVDAPTIEIYKKRVEKLFKVCQKYNFEVDKKNKNPSRLSRLPGVRRGDKWQYIEDTNIGCSTWEEWEEYIQGEMDDLPECEDIFGTTAMEIQPAPELIEGVLRAGRKMIITAPSKSGKTELMLQLALAFARGGEWLGYRCTKSKVLYVDFELAPDSFQGRVKELVDILGLDTESLKGMIDVIRLRGKAARYDKLFPIIKNRVKKNGYKVVILDPIYKTLQGDENDSKVVIDYTNALDALADSGCSVIFSHHHNKSASEATSSINRGSGSGVFARDPDAIMDMLEISTSLGQNLELEPKVIGREAMEIPPNARFYRLDWNLRDYMSPEPTEIAFIFPLHYPVSGMEEARGAAGMVRTRKEKQEAGHDTMRKQKDTRIELLMSYIANEQDENGVGPTIEEAVNYFEGQRGFSNSSIRAWLKTTPEIGLKAGVLYYREPENE